MKKINNKDEFQVGAKFRGMADKNIYEVIGKKEMNKKMYIEIKCITKKPYPVSTIAADHIQYFYFKKIG